VAHVGGGNVKVVASDSAPTNAPSLPHHCSLRKIKLLAGLRVACAKRPISAADIENIAGEIEGELQQMGRAEVNSRVVGDLAIKKLKERDEVAYIRYAIVYLGLQDLDSIQAEIERLLVNK